MLIVDAQLCKIIWFRQEGKKSAATKDGDDKADLLRFGRAVANFAVP